MTSRSVAESETLFRIMADQAPVMIWVTEPSGACTYINQQWLDFTGQSLDEAMGLGWTNMIHPEDKPRAEASFMHSNSAQEPFSIDYRLRNREGSYHWVIDRGKPRFDGSGNYLGYIGTITDITDRKQAEEKFTENRERLELALEATGLGTWDLNPVTGLLSWDNRCKQIFGMPADAFVNYDIFLEGLHPQDRERVDGEVQEAFLQRGSGVFDSEYRVIGLEDKKLRWVKARGKAFHNGEGKVIRFIGTILDITETKSTEEELKSSDERLKEALLVTSTGTWKIDLQTGIDTRDAGLNKLLGLEAKETRVPADDSFTRIHVEDKERIREALEKAVEEKGIYDEECRIFRPDGTMRWIRDRGQVVTDEKGEPLYIIGAAIDITDQKLREEELKVSEERFRSLFYNASVGMVMLSLNGTYFQANPVYCRMLGYTEEELLQLDFQSVTHPDHIPDNIQSIQQLILGQLDSFVSEKKYIRKNGELVWGEVFVSLIRDLDEKPRHLIAIVQDIHQKKEAEESLKLQSRILESMDEGVSVVDEKGIILYTNEAEDEMFGYAPGEMIGQHVTIQNAYSAEENKRIVDDVIRAILENGYWNGEWHNKRKDGSTFFTYAHITSLDLKDKVVMVCVQRDISEEKQNKEMLQRVAEELEVRVMERTSELHEANEQLQRSNAELEQFAYVTSHDLQEPLRKIKTFAYRIEDELTGTTNEPIRRYLDKVIAASDRMSVLIRDLLNYSRLTKQQREPEQVDLNEVLREVTGDFEVLIAQKGARIEAEPLPVVPGIPLQMNQLFFNLLGNSLKFSSPERKPLLHISCQEVDSNEAEAMGLKEGDYYEISFRDNGIGFHPRYSEQIFEIFQRLHSRDQFAGTGIGLALSRRVVENHHGAITAESEEGKGTVFKVYLPAH